MKTKQALTYALTATMLTAGHTAAQTCQLIHEFRAGTGNADPAHLTTSFGQKLFLSATDDTHGAELWCLDASGFRLVKDIHPGAPNSNPSPITSFWSGSKQLVVFGAASASGKEPWVSDGTAAGTFQLLETRPGPDGATMTQAVVVGRQVFFSVFFGKTTRLLGVTDGTVAGSRMLVPTSGSVRNLCPLGDKLLFTNFDSANGDEIWISDGTVAGTKLLKDIRPGASGSSLNELHAFGDHVYFKANDGTNGLELWRTDGTPAGTVLFKDIRRGSGSSHPYSFHAHEDTLYFGANDGVTGAELWKSDGSVQGTVRIKDIRSGPGGSTPSQFVGIAGERVVFAATDDANGNELWISDGTEAGTRLVRDINAGAGNSVPSRLVPVRDGAYFRAETAALGQELWYTDGTAAGTKLVCDLEPGAASSFPSSVVAFRGTVYFSATTKTTGYELYGVRGVAHVEKFAPRGHAGARSVLESTAPSLGGAAKLSYRDGPNKIGTLWLSRSIAPSSSPIFLTHSAVSVDLATGTFLAALAAPQGEATLPIPNDAAFTGVTANLQIWWLTPSAVLPLECSNGVQLALGR